MVVYSGRDNTLAGDPKDIRINVRRRQSCGRGDD